MPCTPLAPVSGNKKTRSAELGPYMRGKVAAHSERSLGGSQIAVLEDLPRTTVQNTFKNDSLHHEGVSRSCPRRPKKISHVDERNILRIARSMPKISYAALKKATGVTVTYRTLYRILKRHHIIN